MKRLAIAVLAVLALGAVIAGAQVVTNPAIPPNTVCAYNTSPPTLTNGQASWIQCDSAGNVKTTAAGGGGGAATIADGADVTEGAIADAAATAGSTGTVSAKLRLMTTQLASVITNTGAATPAGTNLIGDVNLRQGGTALSTTNGAYANVLQGNAVLSTSNPLPVATQGAVNTTLTDCSGTIATGGTAQNAFTANASRHGFTIANIDTSEVLWISFTTTAAASGTGSYPLAPADATTFANLVSFTSPPGMGINTALSVIGATTTHKFSCTVW